MDLDELLGIDSADARIKRARRLLEADRKLLADLVAQRHRLNLTQGEVARRMDSDASVVTRIEAGGRDMHQSTIRRYAMAVEATIEHIVVPIEPAVDRSSRIVSGLSANFDEWPTTGLSSSNAGHFDQSSAPLSWGKASRRRKNA